MAGHYYVFGGQYTSGASVEARGLGGVDYDTLIAEAEEVPPGSLGAFFLPHLRLANPPHDDPAARGAFVGLSTDGARSPLPGRLGRVGLRLPQLARTAPHPLRIDELTAIYAIGGGTQNRLLMRIKATVSNQTITVVGVEEATSLGRHPGRDRRRRLRRRSISPRRVALRREPRRARPGGGLVLRRRLPEGVREDLP